MKVLFAVSNESISNSIVKKYQKEYKEIISYKNVYYFNAILKELQKDKTYERVVISEDLEQFTNSDYEQMDKFIFEKLDGISDEAVNSTGADIPILLICSERRSAGESILTKLFGIGIYNAIMGKDRSIDEVCRLLNRPRTKKEAKTYYRIESDDVNYQAENENDVSEVEVQNILAHYKRLGKNEERYVESFNNIAAQYNDVQLRLISKYLPLNVRAVLEEQSPKYQQIMSFNSSVSNSIRNNKKSQDTSAEKGTSEKLLSNDRNLKLTGPVVVPQNIKREGTKKLTSVVKINFDNQDKDKNIDENVNAQEKIIQEVPSPVENIVSLEEPEKKRRGRPRKIVPEELKNDTEPVEENVKKRRGRPRKNPIENNIQETDEFDDILPGFEKENMDDNILPGFEEDNNILPGFREEENNNDDNILPGFEENNIIDNEEDNILPGFEENNNPINQNDNTVSNYSNQVGQAPTTPMFTENRFNNSSSSEGINLDVLTSEGKKIVTFVGTSKNGTSFIVNSIAEKLSSMGINTAIFDATENQNSYYIYTKNDEELRKTAGNCVLNLKNGIANGIMVNKNLTVYTSVPNDPNNSLIPEAPILETLSKNHTVVLVDCDFKTPLGYFKNSQEMYLIQSMDILTIQPLTAFLDILKAKNILDDSKLRIILNKYVRLRGVNEKTIIGGMAYYNDPEMSVMKELFNRNTVKYVTIPFDMDTYISYLEGIVECNISIKGYSKNFRQILDSLSNMIYPTYRGKEKYVPNKMSYSNGFSSSMNDTLNKMKQQKNY